MAKCLHSDRDELPKTSERERKVAKNSFPALFKCCRVLNLLNLTLLCNNFGEKFIHLNAQYRQSFL